LSTSKKALGDALGDAPGGQGRPRLGVRMNLRPLHGDVAAANFRNAGLSAMRRRSLALGSVLVASLAGCALGPEA
jgi:hypothetical protein